MDDKSNPSRGARFDFFLDITDQVCPMTFVRTRLLIDGMAEGQTAEIRLRGREPIANVPRSVREHGHAVLALVPETADAAEDGVHLLRIRKNRS